MTVVGWQVAILVVVIIVAILYLSGRPKTLKRRPRQRPTSGAELIDRLQQTLGIAIVVESIDPSNPAGAVEVREPAGAGPTDAPHTIRATLMFGRYTARVVAAGPTESDAWAELAKTAIAWRNSDYQHIPMWGGGA
jgi:hypothetical protein